MGISQIVTGISVFVAGLLPASCHHQTTAHTETAPTAAAISNAGTTNEAGTSALLDLGEVSLTNRYERCLDIGGGSQCIIHANSCDKDNTEIVVTLKSQTSKGKIKDMIVTQIAARSGEPLNIAIGDFQLTLTPNLIVE